MMGPTSNICSWRVETGRASVQGQPDLYGAFKKKKKKLRGALPSKMIDWKLLLVSKRKQY